MVLKSVFEWSWIVLCLECVESWCNSVSQRFSYDRVGRESWPESKCSWERSKSAKKVHVCPLRSDHGFVGSRA